MTWGGNLTKEGSNHIRRLREADNAIKFLEKFKEHFTHDDKIIISKTIDLIVNKLTDKNFLSNIESKN